MTVGLILDVLCFILVIAGLYRYALSYITNDHGMALKLIIPDVLWCPFLCLNLMSVMFIQCAVGYA